jgi:hypothetical protein
VNLFARSPLSDVTPEVVSCVLEQHKVRTAGARELLRDLWRQALVEFIKDDVLTDEEVTYLADLRRVLTLSETESETILDQAVNARYGKELSEAVADGKVSPEEQDGRLTAPVPLCNSDLPVPRQRHTRRKPGPQSHGSSHPP